MTITYEQNPNCFRSSVSLNSVNASLCVHHRQRKIVCVCLCVRVPARPALIVLMLPEELPRAALASGWAIDLMQRASALHPPYRNTHTPPIQLLKALYG